METSIPATEQREDNMVPSDLNDELNEAGQTAQIKAPPRDLNSTHSSYENWLRSMFAEPSKRRKRDMSVAFQNLNVYGFGTTADYQKTFSNYPIACFDFIRQFLGGRQNLRIDILHEFEGLVKNGEMLMVLGKPGSGCSTLLKTLAGQTHGIYVDPKSEINYQGIPPNVMHTEFRGECTYLAESDNHFPHLNVAQTLAIAAEARTPANIAASSSERKVYAREVTASTVSALGLSHTMNVKVGSDFIRGISGGERKRTSIAEVLVGGSAFQCWDNSTRGLDSANALNLVKILKQSTAVTGSVAIVTMYQASQDIFDLFDKVILLYEGHEIFFGSVATAKEYFTKLGFICSDHATTSDFLTSLTNPVERIIREGFEPRVPRTPIEFARIWKESSERAKLLDAIDIYGRKFEVGGEHLGIMREAQKFQKDSSQRSKSPYLISFKRQILLCITRAFQRIANDLAPAISSIVGNMILSIILGSMFYNMSQDTDSFYGRGVLLFFVVLTNAFLGAFEGVQLWDQRPIVERHFQYAFYHPSAEAIASMLCDLPNKLLLTTFFNIPLYFMANMRRTPGAFFTFYLFAFASLLAGSMLFRTIGAMSKTLTSSIAPGATFVLMLLIYIGFVLPIPSMHPWFSWIRYLDFIAFAFESMMINEFSGREFSCATFVPEGPGYLLVNSTERRCTTPGAETGSSVVNGDAYLATGFHYYPDHLWRNLGIIMSLTTLLCGLYLLATEYISTQRSKGEVLIFRRGHMAYPKLHDPEDGQYFPEKGISSPVSESNTSDFANIKAPVVTHGATFVWDNLSYEVKVKDGSKQLLKDVDGWVKPGTLTALMGASGAGKTTLLNVLADRVSTGIISGEKLVDAKHRDDGFARKVGYAQQQDLHLPTSTVREALIFSARLRQPQACPDEEKLEWVDQVIDTLDMTNFSEAVIGVPGEGLNIEQRKRVTIGIELAAKPELLLFLDEPTSGLDSNTAWSICTLLRKLADNGQAILCTIHQPSSILFHMFDRLLFLADGKQAYFGDIGYDSRILTAYFESHGARKCGVGENPAEWLLEITSSSTNSENAINWSEAWVSSEERRAIKDSIELMKTKLSKVDANLESVQSHEFATSFFYQLYIVTRRNLEHDWQTPSYCYSKIFMTAGAGLINGFSFYNSANSIQGIQNQIFSVFLVFTLHSNLIQVLLPQFLGNRTLYEIRERPSRTYSWTVFILSNIIAELPWQTLLAAIQFATWYYPIGFYQTAVTTHQITERGGLMFLLMWSFMIFSSTFSQMLGTIMPDAATGINISALLWSLSLIFSGVLVSPSALPRFWIFMYRVSPVTYLLDAVVSTGIAGVSIQCAANEIVKFDPPSGQNCSTYLDQYLQQAGGQLLNPRAVSECQFCPIADTDSFLATLGIFFDERWRNFGISLAYIVANVAGALVLYWLFRVKSSRHT